MMETTTRTMAESAHEVSTQLQGCAATSSGKLHTDVHKTVNCMHFGAYDDKHEYTNEVVVLQTDFDIMDKKQL